MQYLNKFYKMPVVRAVRALDKVLTNDHAEAKRRKRILDFYEQYGLAATLSAFDICRSSLFKWRKMYGEEGLRGLMPLSKAPHKKRKSAVLREIDDFVINYRRKYGRVSQEVIKPHLDKHCLALGIKTVSSATIGRVIKKLKELGQMPAHYTLSYNAKADRFTKKKIKKKPKLRIGGYKPRKIGSLLQADSVKLMCEGKSVYLINAIDLRSRYAFTKSYERLNSANAKEFFEEVKKHAPFDVKRVQTDNGSEFEKHFRNYVKKEKLIHYHNYPKSPKSKAFIERFNRTIQEQCIYNNWESVTDMQKLQDKLKDYIQWYNQDKPHRGINLLTPKEYLDKHLNKT